MKKTIIFFLAFITLFTAAAGCSPQKQPADTTEISAETGAEDITETGDLPEVEESDYGGEEFMILYIDWSLYSHYYFAEEANGDAVNDAIYERSSKIEEYLNIDINSHTEGPVDTPQYNLMKKTVFAGEDVYDLSLIHNSSDIGKYVSDRIILNWNNIPDIDMTKSYWNKSVKKNMEVEGILPFASNDFMIPDINSIFFNKLMIENYTLPDPYALVRNGEWTWDELIRMAASASSDINGDGIFDENDQYGFVIEYDWQLASIVTGCGQYMIQIDEGQPQIVFNTPKMVSIVEKFNDLFKNSDIAFTWPYSSATDPNAGGKPPVSFDSGRALFYGVPLSLAGVFRETDVDFGILPMPKYDTVQNEYITLNWTGFMCVPASVANTEIVGKTVELLGYYNGQLVIPAFYNILLGQKISRDTESQEMLDILFNNIVHDLGINLGLDFYMVLPYTLNAGGNFASYYEKNIKKLETIVEKYYSANREFGAAQ